MDIMEMYKPEPSRLREFWTTVQDVWLKLYGSPFPTAAAINGHCPAGGCMLAMACEYRVMVPNYKIGLNESQLGIVATPWFMATMRNTISLRHAEMALTLGTLFETDEALKIGLVDELAKDKPDAIAKCEAFLDKFKKIPPLARAFTKQQFRRRDLQALVDNRAGDLGDFVELIENPKVQQTLGSYIEALKKKNK